MKATEFGEMRQNSGHYAIQGHSRSPIFVPVKYDLYLVINTNLPLILHRFLSYGWLCQIFYSVTGSLHLNALAGGDPYKYWHKWYTTI